MKFSDRLKVIGKWLQINDRGVTGLSRFEEELYDYFSRIPNKRISRVTVRSWFSNAKGCQGSSLNTLIDFIVSKSDGKINGTNLSKCVDGKKIDYYTLRSLLFGGEFVDLCNNLNLDPKFVKNEISCYNYCFGSVENYEYIASVDNNEGDYSEVGLPCDQVSKFIMYRRHSVEDGMAREIVSIHNNKEVIIYDAAGSVFNGRIVKLSGSYHVTTRSSKLGYNINGDTMLFFIIKNTQVPKEYLSGGTVFSGVMMSCTDVNRDPAAGRVLLIKQVAANSSLSVSRALNYSDMNEYEKLFDQILNNNPEHANDIGSLMLVSEIRKYSSILSRHFGKNRL